MSARPPRKIQAIPGLCALDEDHCGVYFLCRAGQVVYVGSSLAIRSRVRQHRADKNFDQVFFVKCAPDERGPLESLLILALDPEYNGQRLEHYRAQSFAKHPVLRGVRLEGAEQGCLRPIRQNRERSEARNAARMHQFQAYLYALQQVQS